MFPYFPVIGEKVDPKEYFIGTGCPNFSCHYQRHWLHTASLPTAQPGGKVINCIAVLRNCCCLLPGAYEVMEHLVYSTTHIHTCTHTHTHTHIHTPIQPYTHAHTHTHTHTHTLIHRHIQPYTHAHTHTHTHTIHTHTRTQYTHTRNTHTHTHAIHTHTHTRNTHTHTHTQYTHTHTHTRVGACYDGTCIDI